MNHTFKGVTKARTSVQLKVNITGDARSCDMKFPVKFIFKTPAGTQFYLMAKELGLPMQVTPFEHESVDHHKELDDRDVTEICFPNSENIRNFFKKIQESHSQVADKNSLQSGAIVFTNDTRINELVTRAKAMCDARDILIGSQKGIGR